MSSYVTTSAARQNDVATGYVTAPVAHRVSPAGGYVSHVRTDRAVRGYTRSDHTQGVRHLA